jgi:GxxExxY protein
MDEQAISKQVLDAAIIVHTALGAGLLENVYEVCLAHQLGTQGLHVQRQLAMPIRYQNVELDIGYRLDLLVGGRVVVEIKATEKLLPLHCAQLLTYLKLGQYKLGLLLNFNTIHLRDGIRRVVNNL